MILQDLSFAAPSTCVVHEPTNPNDKIYIRTEHHGGGRQYRYKLRINK